MKKRLLSLLFALCTVLSGLAPAAWALPGGSGGPLPFADVPQGKWFYEPIRFVYSAGLMSGVTEISFQPQARLTRAQAVMVLWLLASSDQGQSHEPGPWKDVPFTDVPEGSWYAHAVKWAYNAKITGGVSPDRFGPDRPVTRQDFAVMLYKYHDSVSPILGQGWDPIRRYPDVESISRYALPAMCWADMNGLISGTGEGTIAPKGYTTRAQAAVILRAYLKHVR